MLTPSKVWSTSSTVIETTRTERLRLPARRKGRRSPQVVMAFSQQTGPFGAQRS